MKSQSYVERLVTWLIIAVGISAGWFFRLDISEGWDIGYIAFLALLIGISMGIEIGKGLHKGTKK